MRRILIILVLMGVLSTSVAAGCAAGEAGSGGETMQNQANSPEIDNVIHEKVETATFSMG